MLKIKSKGEFLDLDVDVKISMTIRNPMFFGDKDGSGSYQVQLPRSVVNDGHFKYFQQVNSVQQKWEREDCEIFLNGVKFLEGGLTYQGIVGGKHSCYIGVGKGDFYSIIGDMKLQDLEFGGAMEFADYNAFIACLDDTARKKYPEVKFAVFPVYNPKYDESVTAELTTGDFGTPGNGVIDFLDYVNYWNYGSFHYPYTPTFDFPNQYNVLNYSLFPYVEYVIRCIFEENGFTFERSIFEQFPEMSELCFYSMFNEIDIFEPFFSYVTSVRLSKHLPDVSCKDFLLGFCNMFCLNLIINPVSRKAKFELNRELVASKSKKDISSKLVSILDLNIEERKKGYQLKMDPETADELFSHVVNFADNKPKFIIKGDVLSLPDPATCKLGDIAFVQSNNMYYQVKATLTGTSGGIGYAEEDGLWQELGKGLDFVDRDFEFVVETPISYVEDIFTNLRVQLYDPGLTANSPYYKINVLNLFKMPHAMQAAGLSFKPRLIFYRGMKIMPNSVSVNYPNYPIFDPHQFTYPFGTNDCKNPDGSLCGDLSLQWGGEHGLYEKFWKEWIHFNNVTRKEMKATINFMPSDIASLDISEKMRCQNFDIFWKELRFDLGVTGMSLVEGDVVKL